MWCHRIGLGFTCFPALLDCCMYYLSSFLSHLSSFFPLIKYTTNRTALGLIPPTRPDRSCPLSFGFSCCIARPLLRYWRPRRAFPSRAAWFIRSFPSWHWLVTQKPVWRIPEVSPSRPFPANDNAFSKTLIPCAGSAKPSNHPCPIIAGSAIDASAGWTIIVRGWTIASGGIISNTFCCFWFIRGRVRHTL